MGCLQEAYDAIAARYPVQTRDQALMQNRSKYFTGKLCRNGHASLRYASSGICVECQKEAQKATRGRKNQLRAGILISVTLQVPKGDRQHIEEYAAELVKKNNERMRAAGAVPTPPTPPLPGGAGAPAPPIPAPQGPAGQLAEALQTAGLPVEQGRPPAPPTPGATPVVSVSYDGEGPSRG